MSINYSFNYNLSQPTIMPDKLNSYDAAYYLNQGLANDGMKERFNAEEMELLRTVLILIITLTWTGRSWL